MYELNIGHQIRCLNNMIMRFVDNRSSKKYLDKVTGSNGWIIAYIDIHSDRDIFQKDLEDSFNITKSTVSKVINLMEQKGLIKRESVNYDARLKKLVLTDKSRECSKLMRADAEDVENTLMAGFTDEEINQLFSYVERMKNNIKNA